MTAAVNLTNLEHRTAREFSRLAGLRGISSLIEWKEGQYWANGIPCGTSVHGLYAWLNKQPGVLP